MRVTFFSAKPFEREPFDAANRGRHELDYQEASLCEKTTPLAEGAEAICAFVNDDLSAPVLEALAARGVRLVVLRSAGFNHVDVQAAEHVGLTVGRVPAYSPHAVAEHTIALMLCLNRKLHRAYQRVREQNFALMGLLGFDMNGKTAGVIGTGEIGEVVCRILKGFGCRVLASDPNPNPRCEAMGVEYVELPELYRACDIITLHCPLTPHTHHLIDDDALSLMRDGVMLINTSRGAVIDTRAAIASLKSRRIGALGLDVYEEEGDLFFRDLSERIIDDDLFVRLMTFPNVLITSHQAFFTHEAVANIAETTMENVDVFAREGVVPEANSVTHRLVAKA
ncbi:MAG: 2-hydroxyacid dehydrogenase [Planctomycetota bacterium]